MKKNLLIVRLSGGLGNQLFQFATGFATALRNNLDLKVDVGWFMTQTERAFVLDKIGINVDTASEAEVKKVLGVNDNDLKKGLRKLGYLRSNLVVEKEDCFHDEILELDQTSYLKGYWQNPKYFDDLGEEIRKLFRSTPVPAVWDERIRQCESVGVHVRRGDYVASQTTNLFHGVLPPEYYLRAVDEIRSVIKDPFFFVFSDDIDYSKSIFLKEKAFEFVRGNSDEEDLLLMSRCRHQIIANSSFSWWGAWLNINPEKIVIAPKQWFRDPATNARSANFVPSEWLRLSESI